MTKPKQSPSMLNVTLLSTYFSSFVLIYSVRNFKVRESYDTFRKFIRILFWIGDLEC